jgi:hypothetical protein
MRNFEACEVENEIAEEDEIEVERTGPIGDCIQTVTAKLLFKGQQSSEEFEGRKRGVENEGGVEEARLAGESHGGRGVERRTS